MLLEGYHISIPEECFRDDSSNLLLNRKNPSFRMKCCIKNIGTDGRIEYTKHSDIEISLKRVEPPIKENFLLQDSKILQVGTVYLWPTFIVEEVDKLLAIIESGIRPKEVSVQLTKMNRDIYMKCIIQILTFKVKDFLKIVKWAQVAYFGGGTDCPYIPQYQTTSVKRLEKVIKILENRYC